MDQNISIDRGTTFVLSLTFVDDNDVPMDLTGYTINGAIRKSYTSANSITFTTAVDVNNSIAVLTLDSNTSNIIPGKYVYDVLASGNGVTTRVVGGIAIVNPTVCGVTANVSANSSETEILPREDEHFE